MTIRNVENWQRTKKRTAKSLVMSCADVIVPRGWKLMREAASDMTPCGCVRTRNRGGIDAVPIIWRAWGGRYWLRCGACGKRWSRAIPANAKPGALCIDGHHPEEIKAKRKRKKREQAAIARERLLSERLKRIRLRHLARRKRQ